MSIYTTGTINVTNGSNAVVGVGTSFLTNVTVGDSFIRTGDSVSYTVASITDDTHLTLSANYGGATGNGVAYSIGRDFDQYLGVPELAASDPDYPVRVTQAIRLLAQYTALGHKIPDNLAWEVRDVAGNSLLKVDEYSSNVGIGTTSPSTKLHINGQLTVGESANSGINPQSGYLLIGPLASETYIDAATNGSIHLRPNGSNEVLTILNSGNVGIGTTVPSYQLQLSTDSAAKPSTNTWTVASDDRLKQDIIQADISRCYEIVKFLPLKRYTWKGDIYSEEQVPDRSKLGWVAQDVQKVFPKGVNVHEFKGGERPELDAKGDPVMEPYEEQEFILEANTIEEKVVEIVNGQPIQVIKTKVKEDKILLWDEIKVKDGLGNIVIQDDGLPLVHKMPRMVIKQRPKMTATSIPDCLGMNADQIYAAMFGAIQALITKVEALESKA